MKKQLLFMLILLSNFSFAYSQRLKIDEVDKFSKEVTQETTAETLYSANLIGGASFANSFEFCLRKTGDSWTMPACITLRNVEKYDDDSGIILLLSNGESITLKTAYTGIGVDGIGYNSMQHGCSFNTCFRLSKDDIQKLSDNDVTDIRIKYLGGSYDRTLKGKKTKLIRNMIKLFN